MMWTARVAIIATQLTALLLFADISPEEYEKMQRAAPEVLQIRVTAVDVHRHLAKPHGCGFFDFEVIRQASVDAEVLRVVRSGSAVATGQVIKIEYASIKRCSGLNGLRSIELLRSGEQPYAYFVRDKSGVFVPAAGAASFASAAPTW